MKTNHIENKFADMGARLKVRIDWQASDYAIDIQRDRAGEFFEFRVPETRKEDLDLTVLQAQPRERHLLLLVRKEDPHKQLDRFLCGHDEREWFVAAVPGTASTVWQAKNALQPVAVRQSLRRNGVPERFRHIRKNSAFVRQGEWFFVPEPAWAVPNINTKFVLRDEPIRRGGGKPHIVEEIYRIGGEQVYVSSERPGGITEAQYRKLLWDRPHAANWNWQIMRRNMRVYARGAVRHSDHATIYLRDWHRVVLNTETEARSMSNMAFLD